MGTRSKANPLKGHCCLHDLTGPLAVQGACLWPGDRSRWGWGITLFTPHPFSLPSLCWRHLEGPSVMRPAHKALDLCAQDLISLHFGPCLGWRWQLGRRTLPHKGPGDSGMCMKPLAGSLCGQCLPRPLSPISRLTPDPLCSLLCRHGGQVLSESDLDNDNMLSFSEFEHAMAKAPDFMK